jgi:hypothetical protein
VTPATSNPNDDRLEALAKRVDRLEAEAGLSTTAPDGSRVSFDRLLALGLTRRQALAALGFVAAGATTAAAIGRALEAVTADDENEDVQLDGDELDVRSIRSAEQRLVDDGGESEFVWTVEDGNLVLEGLNGEFAVRNPRADVDGESRAIVYEGGTFESVHVVELDYESAEPALGIDAAAGEYSVSYGRQAGRENEDRENVSIGDRAGDGSAGERNAFVGRETGRGADGEENVYVGQTAGRDVSASYNALVGSRIASESEVGESAGIGQWALSEATGGRLSVLGRRAGNAADSEDSIFVGHGAGQHCEGDVVYAFGTDAARDWDEDYTMLVGDDEGNVLLRLDLEDGDLEIAGELSENADL